MFLSNGIGQRGVFRDRDERAGEPPDGAGGEEPSFFDGVVEHRDRGGRTRRADAGDTEGIDNFADTIADRRGWSQREVDDSEGDIQYIGDFTADQFTDTGNAETGEFNLLGQIGEGQFFTGLLSEGDSAAQSRVDDPGTGDTDIHDRFRLADPHIGARHKGVVFGDISEDDEFRGGKAAIRRIGLGDVANDMTELMERVDINPRLAAGRVDRGADLSRLRENLGERVEDDLITGGDSLLHECREAADEIDTAVARGLVEGVGQFQRPARIVSRQENRGG